MDLVSDNYKGEHPLKDQTRLNRGTGTSVSINIDSKLTKNFHGDFLNNSANKNALYYLMTKYFVETKVESSDKL